MAIHRWRPSALAAALLVALGAACGRTELWPASSPAGDDGGTDVPAGGDDAAAGGRGDGGHGGTAGGHHDPCSAGGNPCGDGQRCVAARFRKATGVPGGSDLLLALGDLNRDGLVDLVTVSPSQGSVGVWLNDRTAGFRSSGAHAVAGQPIAATISDFTGDGIADIAVATFSAGNVTTLVGGGDGTFKMGAFASAGMQPRALVATDLDDDGRLDLAVANQDPNRTDDITLLTGIGGGTFVPGGRYGTFPGASALAVGDFNGDGAPDVAAASAAVSSVDVLYHASFSLPFSQHVDSGARTLAVGDFDEDGIDDLAVSGTGSVAILLGTHNTALATGPLLAVTSAPAGTASTVVAGDFDGDGHTDLAFADGRQVYLFPNTGRGQFQPERALLAATGNDVQPTQLAAGDLDGDGVTDLLVGSVQGQIVELLSAASAVLTPAPPVPIGGISSSTVTGDFDGDGNVDVAIAQYENQVGVLQLLGDGRGGFPRSHVYAFGSFPQLALAGDLDGDARSDLLVFSPREANVNVRLARSDGTLGDLRQSPIGRDFYSAVVLDANEDGRLDIAVTGVSAPTGPALLLGNGDGTFQRPVEVGAAAGRMAAADLDGDGHADLAIADGAEVRVHFGDGRAHFPAQTTLPLIPPLDLLVGDASGDGRADIIAYNTNPNNLYTLPVGANHSLFLLGSTPFIYLTTYFAATGDFDGDGRLDVAFDTTTSTSLSLGLGNGDGTFRLGRDFPAPGVCSSIAVTDLNNDGRPDVVAVTTDAQFQGPKLAIWLGTGPFECRSTGM